jgi:ComF family protein
MRIFLWIKEAIFPSLCVVCKRKTFGLPKENQWLCLGCTIEIKSLWRTICSICIKDVNFSEKRTCAHPPAFIRSISFIFSYQNRSVRALIHSLKYRFITDIMSVFSKHLKQERLNLLRIPTDIIIPLPLHKRKLRERGFNQSELLAKDIANLINKPALNNVLIKYRNTPAQMKIKKPDERSKNVHGVFKVKDGHFIKNKSVLLVDDVVTTGATLEEAAKTLVEAGVKNVYAFVLARD